MKHILYFLFIWLLVGALMGSFGFGLIALFDKIPIREVANTYDKKLSYILIFQFVNLLATTVTIFIFLKKEQIGIMDIGLRYKYPISTLQGFIFGSLPIMLIAMILLLRKETSFVINNFSSHNLVLCFFIFVIGALTEEILTRGYVLRYLMQKKNKYWALVLSSILFALFHISNDNLSYIAFLNIFLSGIFLGLFYIYFKSIWFSVSAHFAWNFFQGPVLGSGVSGLKTESLLKQTLTGPDLITGGAFGYESSVVCTLILILFIFLLYLFCKKYPLSQVDDYRQ
ncbi:lysostaphin resistance A-like protein [Pedobacter sp. GSP4]|uniref:CPBP family intramembrane glutamic endopeptidase n=1 Tax=Pedobacter sp. GSP4 TaxID=3453716 RepID=UPI003EE83D03